MSVSLGGILRRAARILRFARLCRMLLAGQVDTIFSARRWAVPAQRLDALTPGRVRLGFFIAVPDIKRSGGGVMEAAASAAIAAAVTAVAVRAAAVMAAWAAMALLAGWVD